MAAYHTLIYLNYAWNYYSEIYVSDIYTDLLHLQEKKNLLFNEVCVERFGKRTK